MYKNLPNNFTIIDRGLLYFANINNISIYLSIPFLFVNYKVNKSSLERSFQHFFPEKPWDLLWEREIDSWASSVYLVLLF